MSKQSTVVLMAVLTPDNTSRRTMRAILAENSADEDDYFEIGDQEYHSLVMEGDWDECWGIRAEEGDLVFFAFARVGQGNWIAWSELDAKRVELQRWAEAAAARHRCSWEIRVCAIDW